MKKVSLLVLIVLSSFLLVGVLLFFFLPEDYKEGIGNLISGMSGISFAGTCTYFDDDFPIEARCNELIVSFEYGLFDEPNKFQDQILSLIKEYNARIGLKSEDYFTVLLPNDKKIYELKGKLEKVEHIYNVGFDNVNIGIENGLK